MDKMLHMPPRVLADKKTHAGALARLWTRLAVGIVALCIVAITIASRSVSSRCPQQQQQLAVELRHAEVANPSNEEMLSKVDSMMQEVDIDLNTTQLYWFDFLRVGAHLRSPGLARCGVLARQGHKLFNEFETLHTLHSRNDSRGLCLEHLP